MSDENFLSALVDGTAALETRGERVLLFEVRRLRQRVEELEREKQAAHDAVIRNANDACDKARRLGEAEAEVRRLEKLIVEWADTQASKDPRAFNALLAEAQRIREREARNG